MEEKEAVDRLGEAPSPVVEAYRRHRDDLMRFATVLVGPDDAQEVVSAAMLRLLDRPKSHVEKPKPYLYRAVTNQARNHQRSEWRRRHREQRAASREPAPAADGWMGYRFDLRQIMGSRNLTYEVVISAHQMPHGTLAAIGIDENGDQQLVTVVAWIDPSAGIGGQAIQQLGATLLQRTRHPADCPTAQ